MSAICSCDTVIGNVGLPGCYKGATVPKGVFLVPQFANDGTKNEIDATDTIDDAYILAMVRNVDPSKRWYPLQDIKNVTTDRADPVYDTAGDGSKAFVKDGIRTYSFESWKGGARLKKQLDKARCTEFGFYTIEDGRINGIDLTDERLILSPIRIATDSLVIKYVAPTDSLKEKLLVTFDLDQREDDGNFSYIEVEDDADLTGYRGLLDIFSEISNKSTTGFKARLFNKYIAMNDETGGALEGLVAGDFALHNVTDSSAVTITTAVEAPAGVYTFTFSAQTSADVLRLTPTKAGYDFAEVVTNTIVVP